MPFSRIRLVGYYSSYYWIHCLLLYCYSTQQFHTAIHFSGSTSSICLLLMLYTLQLATGTFACHNYGQPSMGVGHAIQLMFACIAHPQSLCPSLPASLPPPPCLVAVCSTPPLPNFFCLPGDPGQDTVYLAAQPASLMSIDQ